MSDREQLLEEAQELGIEFQSNTPSAVLEQRIAEAKAAQGASSDDEEGDENDGDNPEQQDPDPAPAAKKEPKKKSTAGRRESKQQMLKRLIRERKQEAMKTRIVTITNRDNRENDHTTTAYLGFENQHFSLSKVVPLDVPVELEQCLIDVAKSCTITLHKAEMKDGKRTGNHIPVTVSKYTISYSDQQVDSE